MKPLVSGALLVLASLTLSAQSLNLASTVNPTLGPAAGGGGDSYGPVLSADGRYVLFASTANNLMLATNNNPIPALIPASLNVYLRDRNTGTTRLVSVNLAGVAGGNGDSLPIAVSTNGRFALFESSASDLVPGDTNNATDVFVRDFLGNTTVLASANTNGVPGNGVSGSSSMTPDGRYIAFVSGANDLVPGDTNQIPDVFVRDLLNGNTVLASLGATSTATNVPTGSSEAPQITPDGHYVAFYSTATNLVPGVPVGGDVYVRNLIARTTIWVSTGARTALSNALKATNCVSYNQVISDDGRFIAYEASSGAYTSDGYVGLILRYDLATGLTDLIHTNAAAVNSAYESVQNIAITPDGRFVTFIANTNDISTTCVQLWDATTGNSTLVSGDMDGQVSEASTCDFPATDPTGRFVLFQSSAPNLTTNDLVGDYHFYVRDMQAGSTVLVDADTNAVGSPISPATVPSMSGDARFVAFDCSDASLVPNDNNRASDAFVRDLTTASNELISVHDSALPCITPNGPSLLATTSVDADGGLIAFASEADNLVPHDTNEVRDIFVRDVQAGKTVLVSVGTNGFSADGVSTDPAISPDGRFVAFTSYADDLVGGDINNVQDVFLRDLQLGVTKLVSVNRNGTPPGNKSSYSPAVSANGRYVLFRSLASDLAVGTFAYGSENLFLRDVQGANTYALTTTGDSGPTPAMTPDGRLVAYLERGTYLYVWDSQSATRVYTNVYTGVSLLSLAISSDGHRIALSSSGNGSRNLQTIDLVTKQITLVDSNSAYNWSGVRLNADGTRLAILKTAFPSGTNQVFLYDLVAGTNMLVSHTFYSADPANGASDSVDISADGRFIAYRSAATNVVAADNNDVPDVFVYDTQTGINSLLSVSRYGTFSGDNRSLTPVFSGDGRTVCFASWASDLLRLDFNYSSDIFAFKFLTIQISPSQTPGEGPWFSWPSAQGKAYRVQFRDSTDSNWQDLTGGITNVGNKAYLQDTSPPGRQRFYRVNSN